MFTSGEGEVKMRGVRVGVGIGDFSVKARVIKGAAAVAYGVEAVSASFLL